MLSVGVATFSYRQRKTDANSKRKPVFFYAGSALLVKLQPRNYFYSFHPFEPNVGRMVEFCIPNNRIFFVFSILTVLEVKWRHKIDSKLLSLTSVVTNR